jgi:hypothetical protein
MKESEEFYIPRTKKFKKYTIQEKMDFCYGYIDLLSCLEVLDKSDIDTVDHAILFMSWNKARNSDASNAYIEGAVKFYEMHQDLIESITQISLIKSLNKNKTFDS